MAEALPIEGSQMNRWLVSGPILQGPPRGSRHAAGVDVLTHPSHNHGVSDGQANPEDRVRDGARLLELSAPGNALIERTARTLPAASAGGIASSVMRCGLSGQRSRTEALRRRHDRKIVIIEREIGTITGRVVQTMFDFQPATTSRILV